MKNRFFAYVSKCILRSVGKKHRLIGIRLHKFSSKRELRRTVFLNAYTALRIMSPYGSIGNYRVFDGVIVFDS